MPPDLRRIPLFANVGEQDLRPLARKAITRCFSRGAVILRAGDQSDALYVITEGKVKVFLASESGGELVLGVRSAGEYFGELALDEQARSASIMALQATRCVVVPAKEFKALLFRHPGLAMEMIRNLSRLASGLDRSVRGLSR